MGLMFGTQDELDCLQNTSIQGPEGEALCLASKISLHFVGAGVYVSDHGYVLKPPQGSTYYDVGPEKLKAFQAEGRLPTPLPPYHISIFQYALGYSLWLVILGCVIAWGLKRMFGKLRPFLAAEVAPVTGPPIARTAWDRWLVEQVGKRLEPGEKLQHQAIATNFEPGTVSKSNKTLLLALTDRRLLTLEALYSFTGMKKEVGEITTRSRAELASVDRQELVLTFHFSDGSGARFWIVGSLRSFSNQWLFARDVPKLLMAAAAPQVVNG